MTSRALGLLICLLAFSTKSFAIEQYDPFLPLAASLPPSLIQHISRQTIFNAETGQVRFIPGAKGISRQQLENQIDSVELSRSFVFFGDQIQPAHDGPSEIICQCDLLQPNEFIVSEAPIRLSSGRYVSINDETYKAVMELFNYPLNHPELASVAFSELAYVYNADVLEIFLSARGHELVAHRGFMNSLDYPGYRDTQYFITRDTRHTYIVIRGTSGAKDIETSIDAELTPFYQLGLAHGGFLDIAKHLLPDLRLAIEQSDLPVIITGHSLGGSVALTITLMLVNEGYSVSNLNFTPVPPVDQKIAEHFEGLANIKNYFLANEELADLESSNNWLRLPGERKLLPDVGTTAGAAHFVINYLKSMLIVHGHSRDNYEASLQDCVLIKYSCFNGNVMNFISACAFSDNTCMKEQIDFLLGYPTQKTINDWPAPNNASVGDLIRQNTNKLISGQDSKLHHKTLTHRLAYLHLLAGDPQRAINLLSGDQTDTTQGFRGLLSGASRSPATSATE